MTYYCADCTHKGIQRETERPSPFFLKLRLCCFLYNNNSLNSVPTLNAFV